MKSPMPDPRYSRPASNQELAPSISSFANGVPAPKSSAAPSAARTPREARPPSHLLQLGVKPGHGELDHDRGRRAIAPIPTVDPRERRLERTRAFRGPSLLEAEERAGGTGRGAQALRR